jgi:hypothetical protein
MECPNERDHSRLNEATDISNLNTSTEMMSGLLDLEYFSRNQRCSLDHSDVLIKNDLSRLPVYASRLPSTPYLFARALDRTLTLELAAIFGA